MSRQRLEAGLARSLRRNLITGTAGILLLFGGVGGWAATADLSGAVIASGILTVEGNVKAVQHPAGGIVSELRAKEGQAVEAGQVLLRLDATETRANLAAVSKNLDQLYARQSRLEAERDGGPAVKMSEALLARLSAKEAEATMASERRLFEDRRISREGQKARLREQVAQLREQIIGLEEQQRAKDDEITLIDKELEGTRRLYEGGVIALNRVNNLDRSVARLRGERGQLVASIASTRAKIQETELQLLQVDQQMRTEVAAELRDVGNKQTELIEQEAKALNALKHIEIRAPIAGAVHRLAIHTVGGVITPAEKLMEIVPKGSALTVEARIAPQDIDQLAIGQGARLRFTAFNRNSTPELTGTLVRLSADLETDEKTGTSYYRAAISVPDDEIARLSGLVLVPGMPVESFITTGERTVASYLTKPIRDQMQRVFRQD